MTNGNGAGFNRRLLLGGAAVLATGLAGKGMAMAATRTTAQGTAQSGYAPVDGLKVYYEIHGGPLTPGKTPFVLLHGGIMAIETAWTGGPLLPGLAAIAPVIAIEAQGHGHTADRDGPANIERMSDDVSGVLKHLGVARAHVIGHSLGGMMATGMAIRHPDQVASLTPISATYTLGGMIPEIVAMQTDPTHVPSAEVIPLLPTEADFNSWKANYDRVAPDPKAFDGVLAKMNVMLGGWKGWTKAQLGAIRAPTLVAIGDNDFVRIEHAAEMHRLIPGAQLAVLPGTMHMSIHTKADLLIPMIKARIATTTA